MHPIAKISKYYKLCGTDKSRQCFSFLNVISPGSTLAVRKYHVDKENIKYTGVCLLCYVYDWISQKQTKVKDTDLIGQHKCTIGQGLRSRSLSLDHSLIYDS